MSSHWCKICDSNGVISKLWWYRGSKCFVLHWFWAGIHAGHDTYSHGRYQWWLSIFSHTISFQIQGPLTCSGGVSISSVFECHGYHGVHVTVPPFWSLDTHTHTHTQTHTVTTCCLKVIIVDVYLWGLCRLNPWHFNGSLWCSSWATGISVVSFHEGVWGQYYQPLVLTEPLRWLINQLINQSIN